MIYEGDIQGILPFFVQNGKKIHQFEEKSDHREKYVSKHIS